MNFDCCSKDLDALITYIDHAISSAQTGKSACTPSVDALISIAQIAKKYAISEKNGGTGGTAFLQDLIQLCNSGPVCSKTKDTVAAPLKQLNQPVKLTVEGAPERPAIQNTDGKKIVIGKCLGSGGQGSVYKLPSFPGKVAKIYHSHKLDTEELQIIERKLRFLVRNREAAEIGDALIAALPEDILYYGDGSLAGYIMPQFITSTKLCDVQREGKRRSLLPEMDYRGLIVIAYNLAEAVHHLHSRGIVIGDMNPNNILVQADGLIGLIDADSFDVIDPDTGEHFRCVVGLTELLAPELQTVGSLKNANFTTESDCFSLAIHIFRLLMNNADPFGFKMTEDDVSATLRYSVELASLQSQIINGESVYLRDIPGRQIPHWSPELSALPEKIQRLFQRTFGHTEKAVDSIAQRPTAAEWMDALQDFYQMPLTRCTQDDFHLYLPSLSECPFCLPQDSTD